MYTYISLINDIVLATIFIYGYKQIHHSLSLLHARLNTNSESTQTRDSEYNSDVSSDFEACAERTYDWIQDNGRDKRTIFDTVLRLPENVIAPSPYEKSTSPMPIVDQQVLLDSLRSAAKEGIITRKPRTTHSEGTFIGQRINSRGPLF